MEIQEAELNIPAPKGKRVVIVGGGFAGIAAVKELTGNGFQVVLIDRNNFHQFQPLLYQVASSGLEPTAISFPLRAILSKCKDCYFRMADFKSVKRTDNQMETSLGKLHYDYLVIAAGADTNYFGMENVRQGSLPLKSVGEALAMRNHLYKSLEMAVNTTDPTEKEKYLNIVIVGGGATGVELAGAFAELRKKALKKDYREIEFSLMKIYLVCASDRLLEAFSARSSEKALRDLRGMGIEVFLNVAVTDYSEGVMICDKGARMIPSRNLIWASGIVANKIDGIEEIGRGRRIKVDKFNRVEGTENIYAVGDIAYMETDGHPQVAQVVLQQGRNVGENIIRIERGKEPTPFEYNDKGSMATIGRNHAVAEIGKFRFGGFVAWATWLFVHLLFIISFRNKARVVTDWVWSYITHDKPLRSIIEIKRKN